MKIATSLLALGVAFATLGACTPPNQDEHAATAAAEAASPEPEPEPGVTEEWLDTLSCDAPVKADDSIESLLARFGADAVRESIADPDDFDRTDGVVLYPDDPTRRIAVFFKSSEGPGVSKLLLEPPASWNTPWGFGVGTSMAGVEQINGKPFSIIAIDSEEVGPSLSGDAVGFEGGALDLKPGECRFEIRFSHEKNLTADDFKPDDAGNVPTTNKVLRDAEPLISLIRIIYP